MVLHLASVKIFNQFIRPRNSVGSLERCVAILIYKIPMALAPFKWPEGIQNFDIKWIKTGGLVPSSTNNKSRDSTSRLERYITVVIAKYPWLRHHVGGLKEAPKSQ